MHGDARRRVEAVLRHVEPALAGQKIANFDQPGGVVGGQTIDAEAHAQRKHRHRPHQQQEIAGGIAGGLCVRLGGMGGR